MPKRLMKSAEYAEVFNNIIDICDMNGITVTSLIDKFSSSRSAITAWKNGNINLDLVPKIVRELNLTYEQLFEGRENKRLSSDYLSEEEHLLLSYFRTLKNVEKGIIIGEAKTLSGILGKSLEEPQNTIFIEQYLLPVSAGTGVFLDNCDKVMIEVDENELTREANFALRVSGDSMEPDFKDGDVLLVRSQPTVKVGEIGIFILDGEGYVKEFGGDCLISHNKKYKNIKLNEYSEIYCRGLVLGVL